MEEAVLICSKAVLTVCVEQTLGDNAAVRLYSHDEVGVLGEVLYSVLAYLLDLINTVDFLVLFNELALFLDSLFDIAELAFDHLDPFHIDNTVVSVTGELVVTFIGVSHCRYEVLTGVVAIERIFHFSIRAVVSAVINHGTHTPLSGQNNVSG